MLSLSEQYGNIILKKDQVNQEAVRLWLQALRSGEYQQGQSYLRRDDKYCCLGVACEVAIAHGIPVKKVEIGRGIISYVYDDADGSNQMLLRVVAEWLGFDTANQHYWNNPVVWTEEGHTTQSLAALNDSGLSFADIADIIERNWLIPTEEPAA